MQRRTHTTFVALISYFSDRTKCCTFPLLSTFKRFSPLDNMFYSTYLIVSVQFLLYTMAVKIIRHSIPRFVDARITTELILDCEYVYDANDLMLVVKWFHNNSPEPIYQWIPNRNVRYVGELLKLRIDMNYTVNPNDLYSKFRALKLRNNITVDLNGNFSCTVSSLAGQDSRQGKMVVYVPPQSFELNFTEISSGDLALECQAKNVYPRPLLTLSEKTTTNGSSFHVVSKVNVTTEQNRETLFFDASLKHIPQSSSTTGTIFECMLEIPSTNYMRRKRLKIYFPSAYTNTFVDGNLRLFAVPFLTPLIILSRLLLMLLYCY